VGRRIALLLLGRNNFAGRDRSRSAGYRESGTALPVAPLRHYRRNTIAGSRQLATGLPECSYCQHRRAGRKRGVRPLIAAHSASAV
jgi:hypothetical protein